MFLLPPASTIRPAARSLRVRAGGRLAVLLAAAVLVSPLTALAQGTLRIGMTAARPLTIKVLIPSSGSGMMQPIPMNEFLQQNLRDVGVKVDLEVLEWNALLGAWRGGAKDAANRGAVALNYSYFIQDPFTAFVRHVKSDLVSPKGTNWGWYQEKDMDALLTSAQNAFEAPAQTAALQKLHEKFVEDQLFVMVTHDVNARAMSPKVKGFVQAQNWFQNFSSITMTK